MASVRLSFSQTELDKILDNEEKSIFCEKFSHSLQLLTCFTNTKVSWTAVINCALA